MNLIDVLATGVRGAENGSVDVFSRGTSMRAQQFTTAEGEGASTPTEATVLDSNGGATIYVNESVDCIAKDSGGNVVREFTVMDSSPVVEARSLSFKGVDYTTGATAEGNPTTLQAILDKWRLSAGTSDWNVVVGSSIVSLTTAFAGVAGLFYNVRATTYGAAGNGSTDDTSAIQAAINAAATAGGGTVYFPGGTYRITAVLTLTAGVSLQGAGALASAISMDHASNNTLSVSVGTANIPTFIRGLRFTQAQSNTGKVISVEAGTVINITDCTLGSANMAGSCITVDNAATRVTVMGCVFIIGANVSYGVFNDSGVGTVNLIGNRFVTPATYAGDAARLNGGKYVVVGNVFDCSGTSAGTGRAALMAGSYTFVGNRFMAPSGGTIQPVGYSGSVAGNIVAGNSIENSANWSIQPGPTVSASNATHEGTDNTDRAVRRYVTTDNTTPISINPSLYGVAEVRRTNNSAQTINGATPDSAGQLFTLVLNNDQVGVSGTITLGAGFKGQAPFTVAANNVRSLVFRSYENDAAGGGSATKYWGFVGSTGDVTP